MDSKEQICHFNLDSEIGIVVSELLRCPNKHGEYVLGSPAASIETAIYRVIHGALFQKENFNYAAERPVIRELSSRTERIPSPQTTKKILFAFLMLMLVNTSSHKYNSDLVTDMIMVCTRIGCNY